MVVVVFYNASRVTHNNAVCDSNVYFREIINTGFFSVLHLNASCLSVIPVLVIHKLVQKQLQKLTHAHDISLRH